MTPRRRCTNWATTSASSSVSSGGRRRARSMSLQRARMASGLSEAELATELGVCRQTLSAIENRRRIPSVRLALALAIALHRTVEELFPAGELRR
jgi:putative transcriptional regulator